MILRLGGGGNPAVTDSEKLVNRGMMTERDLHHD